MELLVLVTAQLETGEGKWVGILCIVSIRSWAESTNAVHLEVHFWNSSEFRIAQMVQG